jgi:hypothetical protein
MHIWIIKEKKNQRYEGENGDRQGFSGKVKSQNKPWNWEVQKLQNTFELNIISKNSFCR